MFANCLGAEFPTSSNEFMAMNLSPKSDSILLPKLYPMGLDLVKALLPGRMTDAESGQTKQLFIERFIDVEKANRHGTNSRETAAMGGG